MHFWLGLTLLIALGCSSSKKNSDAPEKVFDAAVGAPAARDAGAATPVGNATANAPIGTDAGSIDAGILGRGTGSETASGGAKSAPVPQVRIRRRKVLGQLDRAIVHRFVRNEARAFRACYQRTLNKEPELEGRMDLQFMIIQNGRTRAVRTKGLHKRVDACVAKRVDGIVFPSGSWDGTVQVEYTLTFAPAGALERP